jgi:16S rRNA (adenine1518-N6/adenine1519-N6)-dimethyltransferase
MNGPVDGDLAASIEALPPLRLLVESMDMQARKSLGQNFIFDLNLTRKIARSAGPLTGTTIEIGPGPGGLTRALLLERAAHVIAIEKDRRASAVLTSLAVAAGRRLTLIEADALTSPIWELGAAPRRIIANLPYNIATTLLIQWLGHASCFASMTLMFQREVAERITARLGESAYGRLSVLTGWLADAEILFDVPASAFVPPPKITSSIVQIVPLAYPRFPCSLHALEFITRTAFGQRRKMLRSSLKKINGDELLAEAGIAPESRPQDIDIEGFCKLANLYELANKTAY